MSRHVIIGAGAVGATLAADFAKAGRGPTIRTGPWR